MIIGVILLVVLIFGLLIFVHELGHFVMARRNGVEVEEFGFGFPPKAWGKKVGATEYSINWLPLGGFVRMKGEDAADSSQGSFAAASFWAKTKILFAGVTMNLLTAYLILVFLCLTSLPPLLQNQASIGTATQVRPPQVMVVGVEAGSPAAGISLKQGEIILSANGQSFTSADDLLAYTKQQAGKSVTFKVEGKDGSITERQVQLRSPDAKAGYLGVTPYQTSAVRYGFIDALLTAAAITGQMVWATLAAFGNLIVGLFAHAQVSDQVTGPVGIVAILANVVNVGWSYVLVFIASISISLAVINALPLPALDGGRWTLLAVSKLLGRPLSPRLEAGVHTAGFVVLIGLMFVVTFVDVSRLI